MAEIRDIEEFQFLYQGHALLVQIQARDILIARLRRQLAAADGRNTALQAEADKKYKALMRRLKAYTSAGGVQWPTR